MTLGTCQLSMHIGKCSVENQYIGNRGVIVVGRDTKDIHMITTKICGQGDHKRSSSIESSLPLFERPTQTDQRILYSNHWSYKRQEHANKALEDSVPSQAYALHKYKYKECRKGHNQWLESAGTTRNAVRVSTGNLKKSGVQLFAKKLNCNFSENGTSHTFRDICRRAVNRAD